MTSDVVVLVEHRLRQAGETFQVAQEVLASGHYRARAGGTKRLTGWSRRRRYQLSQTGIVARGGGFPPSRTTSAATIWSASGEGVFSMLKSREFQETCLSS